MNLLETLISKKELEKPIIRTITKAWTFEGQPHIMTEETIFTPNGSEQRSVNALWDTGATVCVVSKSLAYSMGLKPTDRQEYITGNGTIEAETTQVLFEMPDGSKLKTEAVISDMEEKQYNFIAGMNIILHGRFLIEPDGKAFKFSFSVD